MDLLTRMQTFVRVVETGTISAAARAIRLSVPAVSRQLRALEDELGVTLLLRTTRRLELTSAGQRFFDHALRVVREVDDAVASVRSPERLTGTLVVSTSVTLGLVSITPHLSGFMDRYPGLDIDFRLEDRVVALVGEGVDVAIRAGIEPPASTSLIAQRLATFAQRVVASPSYLQAHGTPRHPAMLARHHTLLGRRQHASAHKWRFWHEDEDIEVEVRGRLRTNTLLARRDAAVHGLGLARLPNFVTDEDIAAGRLRVVLEEFAIADTYAYALYRQELRNAPRVRELVRYLRTIYSKPQRGGPPGNAT